MNAPRRREYRPPQIRPIGAKEVADKYAAALTSEQRERLEMLGAQVGCRSAGETVKYILDNLIGGLSRRDSWEYHAACLLFGECAVEGTARILAKQAKG